MKFAGACYLAWLGIQSIRSGLRGSTNTMPDQTAAARVPDIRSFSEGFLTNLLNSKVVVFYLALLPQFIDPDDAVLAKSLLLATIHFAEGILWLGGVAWAVDRSRKFFLRPALRRSIDALCGAILIGLGIRLAFQQR